MLRCSVIIPVYNKANLTRQCVDRLLALRTATSSFEIIVVDDGSSDSTQELLASYGDRIRTVIHETNKAFATACNDGAAIAKGRNLVFLNNDTIPFVGWLDALADYAEARPQVGLVGSKLLYPDGTIQHAGMAVCQDLHPRLIYVGFPANHPAVNKARRMQLVSGACNLLPRAMFERLGGFDTAYINGYEDVDICMRINQLGYEVHYCPGSTLIHLESVSEGRFKFEVQSARIFRERWFDKVIPDDLRYYIEDGLIRVEYFANHIEFRVSPELGVVTDRTHFEEAERILSLRAKQVYSLVRENVKLRSLADPQAACPAIVSENA